MLFFCFFAATLFNEWSFSQIVVDKPNLNSVIKGCCCVGGDDDDGGGAGGVFWWFRGVCWFDRLYWLNIGCVAAVCWVFLLLEETERLYCFEELLFVLFWICNPFNCLLFHKSCYLYLLYLVLTFYFFGIYIFTFLRGFGISWDHSQFSWFLQFILHFSIAVDSLIPSYKCLYCVLFHMSYLM